MYMTGQTLQAQTNTTAMYKYSSAHVSTTQLSSAPQRAIPTRLTAPKAGRGSRHTLTTLLLRPPPLLLLLRRLLLLDPVSSLSRRLLLLFQPTPPAGLSLLLLLLPAASQVGPT
jgi:hypothetical protein